MIVLQGGLDTTATSNPEILPELQHKSFIDTGMGDYHSIALTLDGHVFSWGHIWTADSDWATHWKSPLAHEEGFLSIRNAE